MTGIATMFKILLDRGNTRGFVRLVVGSTFEEQCIYQAFLRDLQEGDESERGLFLYLTETSLEGTAKSAKLPDGPPTIGRAGVAPPAAIPPRDR